MAATVVTCRHLTEIAFSADRVNAIMAEVRTQANTAQKDKQRRSTN